MLVINTVEILAEVFTFTEKSGLEPKIFAEAITESLFAAPVYKIYSNLLISNQLSNPGFKLSLALKDMNVALNSGASVEMALPLISLIRDRLLSSAAKGRGDFDVSALQQLIRDDAGLSTKAEKVLAEKA